MKRITKKWISPSFEKDAETLEKTAAIERNATTITSKTSATERKTMNEKSNFSLMNKLSPKTVSDLAVNNKKVQEVELWLKENVVRNERRVPMLLLAGPTGAGKTAVLNVLCAALDIEIVEWINPVDKQDYETFKGPGQTVRLTEFLTETSKFPSLYGGTESMRKLSLVEDFPNSVVHNPSEFRNVLEVCHRTGRSAIVFICTDVNDTSSNLSQTLFPHEVRDKYGIKTINFNPSTVALLKGALKRAESIAVQYNKSMRIPSSFTVEAIANSVGGDVRSAMNQFQFACLKGTDDLPLHVVAGTKNDTATRGTKRKRPDKSKSTVKAMIKDESLGLFHGLGRVLNPKRVHAKVQCDFTSLVDEFTTRPAMFVSFLHANYLKYFGSFGDASRAAVTLSEAQLFLDKWQQDGRETMTYALWVSSMGLMIYNEHRVSKWNQIKGPTKIVKSSGENGTCCVNPLDYFYYNKISKSNKYPTLKL